jgi:hypothetical protein
MFVKKTKKTLKPSDKLQQLIIKYHIPEEIAVAIGEEAVSMAQRLFEKWKNNFEKNTKKPKTAYS